MESSFSELTTRLGDTIGSLSSAETQAGLPERWNIQQIVQHLTLTYTSTGTIVSQRLNKGRPTRAEASLGQQVKRFFVVRIGYFPRGVTAPLAVTPPGEGRRFAGGELLKHAQEQLMRLDQLLEMASALFGGQTRFVSHMILGPLNAWEWRRFHLVHGVHHIHQIEEMRRKLISRSSL